MLESYFNLGNKEFLGLFVYESSILLKSLLNCGGRLEGEHCFGNPMYRLVKKLKRTKGALKQSNKKEFGCISERIKTTRSSLDSVQACLDRKPLHGDLLEEERALEGNLRRLNWTEESFTRQKSRIHWLKEGDQTTRYFFNCLKSRCNRKRINAIM